MLAKFIKYILKTNSNNENYDFYSFLPDTPPVYKQLLTEKCTKRGISIYDDNPLEQSSGTYSIFRNLASEAELENRLSTKKAIILSERANFIAFLTLIVSAIPLISPFL